jgi:hypothetical protein
VAGRHVDAAGWLVTPPDALTGELRAWEPDNSTLGGWEPGTANALK